MVNVAIFASGSGSNAEKIIEYFKTNTSVSIKIILTNKKDAFVLKRAEKHKIKSYVFDKNKFKSGDLLTVLDKNNIDYIVLAGFLWLVPSTYIKKYSNKIINIHPALLPKYGGKGMYGDNVHKAVIENKEDKSGITIHYVNENYDEGNIIFQAECDVLDNDTPETLAEKIHQLEHRHFPKVIEEVIAVNSKQ